MILRELLIRAYPRSWRNEFGPELAGILADRKLTPAVIADVLASAALQHLRRDPWKICALGLALWTSALLIVSFGGSFDRVALLWSYFAGQLFVFAAGAWTGLREHCGIWRATSAAAKAAFAPSTAFVALSSLRMLHYWGGLREIYGHSLSYWVWKNIVLTLLPALLFGLAGAAFARLVNHFRRTAQACCPPAS
jgi:hypothetical protein